MAAIPSSVRGRAVQAWLSGLCLALLSGCAAQTALVTPAPPDLYRDALFSPASEPMDVATVFAVNDEMRAYLRREIQVAQHGKEPRHALFDALYRKDKLQIDYDSAMTRNAAETFRARSGNCLSLAIMTAALARELQLPVQFNLVEIEESWSRAGSLYFTSNHVNLTIAGQRRTGDGSFMISQSNGLTVDFIPIPAAAREKAKPLEEQTILAMYFNNRAAELLSQGRLDDAYWSVRKAAAQDPAFINSYNTLAVIYQHHGDYAEAERALRYALTRAPDKPIYLSNLAQNLDSQHRLEEAAALRLRMAQLEPNPPFYFFNLGQEAMKRGDYARARALFERELDREPDYHEFHFWLALTDYQLGDLKAADEHMARALRNSTNRGAHDLYAAKLDRIRAAEARRDWPNRPAAPAFPAD